LRADEDRLVSDQFGLVSSSETQGATEAQPSPGVSGNLDREVHHECVIDVAYGPPASRTASVHAYAELVLDILDGGDLVAISAQT
jgi:hypothetical protein